MDGGRPKSTTDFSDLHLGLAWRFLALQQALSRLFFFAASAGVSILQHAASWVDSQLSGKHSNAAMLETLTANGFLIHRFAKLVSNFLH